MCDDKNPLHFPDDPVIDLSQRERDDLNVFDVACTLAQANKERYLKELARRQGLAAMKLEDLKSKSGQPFVEDDQKKTYLSYRTASTQESEYEVAYLCRSRYFDDSQSRCGWVKGKPREAKYDDIGFLCGSSGYRQFCKICGEQIGETQLVVS